MTRIMLTEPCPEWCELHLLDVPERHFEAEPTTPCPPWCTEHLLPAVGGEHHRVLLGSVAEDDGQPVEVAVSEARSGPVVVVGDLRVPVDQVDELVGLLTRAAGLLTA